MRRFFCIMMALFCLTLPAYGDTVIGIDENPLPNPADEARAQQMMKQLRCLVCQNQSIVKSDAALAADLRAIVREQISAGRSNAEILDFMTARYGNWILLKPPLTMGTALLWLGPFVLLLVGGGLVFRFVRTRPSTLGPVPLSLSEKEQLDKILAPDSMEDDIK